MAGSVAGNTSGLAHSAESPRARHLINRKIWLPKLIYNALPAFYLLSGLAALLATLYIGEWYWLVPHSLLVSAACIHLALFVLIRRHRSRRDT